MASRWLKHVLDLNFSHQFYVFIEYLPNELFKFCLFTEAESIESPTKKHEWHLMTCAVIDSNIWTPRLNNVSIELVFCSFYFSRNDSFQKLLSLCVCFVNPILKRPISISHGLLNWRSFNQMLLQFKKVRSKDLKLLNRVRVRNFLGSNWLS